MQNFLYFINTGSCSMYTFKIMLKYFPECLLTFSSSPMCITPLCFFKIFLYLLRYIVRYFLFIPNICNGFSFCFWFIFFRLLMSPSIVSHVFGHFNCFFSKWQTFSYFCLTRNVPFLPWYSKIVFLAVNLWLTIFSYYLVPLLLRSQQLVELLLLENFSFLLSGCY